MTIQGDASTRISGSINDQPVDLPLAELVHGPRAFYLGDFLTPAYCFQRAVPQSAFSNRFTFVHNQVTEERDYYYVRVRQRNGQWAWSSPIWIG
jgi:hypothetical protein